MDDNARDQKNYYQSVSRHLFQLRGAPFVISPKEHDIIRSWEKRQIPLRIILEGIEAAFAFCSPGMKKRLTLNSCHSFVINRFKQHRERRVGDRSPAPSQSQEKSKKARVEKEIKQFLAHCPEEALFLIPVYKESAHILESGPVADEELEKRDLKIDQLILEKTPPAQKKKLLRRIKQDHGLSSGQELERLANIQAVKQFRERHHVPYLSPYYY